MTDKYILRVTAGPGYDESKHVVVLVNQTGTVNIRGDAADIELNVRVRDFHGKPADSPPSSAYFESGQHAANGDQYSIAFRFTPRAPPRTITDTAPGAGGDDAATPTTRGISGTDLLFGNDFDHPIRDRLPPGFNTALSIVQWWIDPGLTGDAYADRPYLYGPALSSFNAIHVGPGEHDDAKGGLWIEEGGDEEGIKIRNASTMPEESKARMKWALSDDNKKCWTFEYGRTYGFDFFNAYLDFSNLTLRLPGFHLPIMKYWDGQGLRDDAKRSHQLRYVLRNKITDETYLVVAFTLHLKDDVNEDGSLKDGSGKAREDARQVASESNSTNEVSPNTQPDDVD